MSLLTADSVPLNSPFAMMFPDAVAQILQRAETLDLPSRRYSLLSGSSVPWAGQRKSDVAAYDDEIDAAPDQLLDSAEDWDSEDSAAAVKEADIDLDIDFFDVDV